MRLATIALLLLPSAGLADYIDDRSSPQAVIGSLYNAVGSGQYSRAWSYFAPASKPSASYDAFVSGYSATASVRVVTGSASEDAGMSRVLSAVPVAIEARQTDGTVRIFAGCYLTQQISPFVQDPPFRGIEIIGGRLSPARGSLREALPRTCDPDKIRRF